MGTVSRGRKIQIIGLLCAPLKEKKKVPQNHVFATFLREVGIDKRG
jgi:hypothetical protein